MTAQDWDGLLVIINNLIEQNKKLQTEYGLLKQQFEKLSETLAKGVN